MPFVKVTLTAPKPRDFATNPQTLGEHLKKRRRELGLLQKEVAARLSVNEWTYVTWETDRCQPAIRMMPLILAFLDYYPFPAPQTLGERLLAVRRHLGLSRKKMAARLSVDEGKLAGWEWGISSPNERLEQQIEKLLALIR